MQNQNMNLVLSADAKPRLKWTPKLHQRFIQAIDQLGGADKATPKSLMRVMGIPALTLYHLKSHLQKYRLGKNQKQSDTCSDYKQNDYKENMSKADDFSGGISDAASNQINESLQMAQALQMQMEVQRKLQEQIEVQRHLQLRIEAQGKYLQKVLNKAQETLRGYSSSSLGVKHAEPKNPQLLSKVSFGCQISKQTGGAGCSMESSLTSSESSGRKKDKERNIQNGCTNEHGRTPVVLPLLDPLSKTSSSNLTTRRKRRRCMIYDGDRDDQSDMKRSSMCCEKTGSKSRQLTDRKAVLFLNTNPSFSLSIWSLSLSLSLSLTHNALQPSYLGIWLASGLFWGDF
ncbi:hypothetical protein Nepgr_033007 [Nepenthes gracilis]|uniref:HTH myb-type domain-containing protein n=1 Tax=Nepenthes gracilis TaxID=150966 RepID=A0AAD3TL45_NEPGR|nr:hypothetical protein Nepgr_033007 [Nepenthes gracilis]